MFADPITLSLILFITSIIGLILWIFFFRNPIAVILVALIIFVINVVLDQEMVSLDVGQYNINLMDVLSVFLLSLAIARLLIINTAFRKAYTSIYLIGILLFVSWCRGILLFNLETSTNSLRVYLYFFAFLFYTTTVVFIIEKIRIYRYILGILGLLLILITIIRWVMVNFGAISSVGWIAPNGEMVRVISAPATFLLLQIMFFILYSSRPGKNFFLTLLTILLFVSVLLFLQQRTIWVALFIGGLIAILLKVKLRSVYLLGILLFFILILSIAIWNNFSFESLTGTTLDIRNLNWRIQGWQTLLDPQRYQTTIDYFIGQPFGTGYSRYLSGSIYETTVSPHNFYIQTLMNIGIMGFVALLIIYGSILKSLWATRSERLSQLFFILLICQLVFYITYAPNFEQGFILGLTILYTQYRQGRKVNHDILNKQILSNRTS